MKKVYLIVFSITCGSLAFGQVNQTTMKIGKSEGRTVAREAKEKAINSGTVKAAGDVLFSENFSTGNLGQMTTSGPDGAFWLNDLDGSNGQYAGTGTAIANTDASNGFAILDGDLATTNDPGHSDQFDAQLVSPAIDLSTVPGALISFYCKYRYWGAYYQYPTLQVSTDNFSSFEEFPIDREGVRTNDVSGTYLVSLNLSKYLSTATNKANFKFRISTNNVNWYFLQIDDINVIEAPANDIHLAELWLDDVNLAYEHTDIPTSIAAVSALTVQAHLVNKGYSNPTNAALSVGIYDASGNQVGTTQTGGSLSNNFSLEHDTITYTTTFDLGSLAIGKYTVRAEITYNETDFDTDNDTLRRTFNRTDYALGQRNYDLSRYEYSPGVRYGAYPQSNPMIFGNIMYIPEDITLHGLEVTIANNSTFYTTTPDADIQINLYQMDFNAADFTASFGGSLDERFFQITPEMIPADGGFNDVVFNFHESTSNPNGMDLTGGNYYYIGVSHPGGDASLSFAVNYDDFDYSSAYFDETEANVYVIGRQAHTRMIFDPALDNSGISEIANNGLSFANIKPNPTTGETTISYNVDNSSNIAVKVLDITGKVVYQVNQGMVNAGTHSLTFDAANLTSGVYYVRVTSDNSQITKKLIKK